MSNSTNILNQALVITAKTMYKEGYITEEQYLEFIKNYFIVVQSPSMLDKLRRKLMKRKDRDDNFAHYDMVKLIHPDNNEDDLELNTLRKSQQSQIKQSKKKKLDRFEQIETET